MSLRRQVAGRIGVPRYAVDAVVANEKSQYAASLSSETRFVILNYPQWGRLHTALYRFMLFIRIKRAS